MSMKFREATSQDHDGIRHLSRGIYGSTDTLVYGFINKLKNDKWFQFVGEINQENIIAFVAVNITDGAESLILRYARVHIDYRGRGVYKALLNYALQYMREKVQDAKFVYSLQSVDSRVPSSYRVLKRMGLVTMSFDGNAKIYIEKNGLVHSNILFKTWPEFKAMYNKSGAVKELFANSALEIRCDIFSLSCKENWLVLEQRVDTRILVTEYEGVDGRKELMISFLRLEKILTNDGVPMTTINIYGLNKEVLKSHIAQGILEGLEHVGGGRFFMELYLSSDVVAVCSNLVKEICSCDPDYEEDMYLLVSDLNEF